MTDEKPRRKPYKLVLITVPLLVIVIAVPLLTIYWNYVKAEVCFYGLKRCCTESVDSTQYVAEMTFLGRPESAWAETLAGLLVHNKELQRQYRQSASDFKFICTLRLFQHKDPKNFQKLTTEEIARLIELLKNTTPFSYDDPAGATDGIFRYCDAAHFLLSLIRGTRIWQVYEPTPETIRDWQDWFKQWKTARESAHGGDEGSK